MISAEGGPICTVEHGEWGDSWPAIRVEPGIGGKAEAYMEFAAYGSIPKEFSDANVQLIAAAPDLYNAGFELAMVVLQTKLYRKDHIATNAVDNMLAILAKARGEDA